ncbi:MAG: phosphomannomutase/phosphoglucomutase [Nitrospiraceae bacterium]|nr:phosphomannomutase/phosphoglucomutase [Nitrospiraceae bacterium]
MISGNIFKEYDIRGIAGAELNKDSAFLIGRAFCSFLKQLNSEAHSVSVGRDVRLSSEELSLGLIDGITSSGIDVIDLGVCPTPLQYFSLFHLDLDGGVMITGSHNPPEYNGFKISIGKDTIYGADLQKLKKIINKSSYIAGNRKGMIKRFDVIAAYKNFVSEHFSYLNSSKFKKIKVVIDAGNGTAGVIAPEIIEKTGCEVIPLYCEPDGNFPNHHPDPTVIENMQDLIDMVKRTKADIGIGYDGDADRIGVVNTAGEIIWGDQLLVILGRELLSENHGAKIISDVKCSQVLFDDIRKHGGLPIMWKTGHSLVKQKMKDEGALLAGEFSGHIFIKDRYFGYDDAVYTTIRLIEIIKKSGKSIEELLSDLPKMYFTPEIRLDCADDKKKTAVEAITSKFIEYKKTDTSPHKILDINTIDGIRVVFEKGWGLIRSSNTQPVIVMRIEALDEDSKNAYEIFLRSEFDKIMEAM